MFIEPDDRGCIYLLTFGNGKVYVGQTRNFTSRMTGHSKAAESFKSKVYNGWRKHGLISSEIIFECRIEDMSKYEVHFISQYDSFHNGYNSTPGGEASPLSDPEVRERHYHRMVAMNADPVFREQHREVVRRTWLDPETRRKKAERVSVDVHRYGVHIGRFASIAKACAAIYIQPHDFIDFRLAVKRDGQAMLAEYKFTRVHQA